MNVISKRWFEVSVKVRYPDQKGYSFLYPQVFAADPSEACRIAVKQVLAAETLEALLGAAVN